MARRIPNSGPISEGARRRLQVIADKHDVPLEVLVDTIRARRFYRSARYQRQYAKNQTPEHRRRTTDKRVRLYAGEAELHGYLKVAGLTRRTFCELVGIHESTFFRWHGHPLHRWPIVFLLYFTWTQNMANFLASKGWDPEKFRPELPPRTTAGIYPRKEGDLTFPEPTEADKRDWKNWSPWTARR